MLPYLVDWHKEHRELIYLSRNVLDKIKHKPQIGSYKITMPIPANLINCHIGLTKKDQQEKWEAFNNIYKSQSSLPVKRFMYEERIYGNWLNEYAAEVFNLLDAESWTLIVDKIAKIDNSLNDLQNYLNKITKKIKIAEKLSKELVGKGLWDNLV